jgi:DNA invertase Pin-like site-specific DNA recombinase
MATPPVILPLGSARRAGIMSSSNGNSLDLAGVGAAYIRVGDDQQDTQRQFAAVQGFEGRHKACISKSHWFKDEGWARDKADERPEFQRLMKLVKAGRVQWIVVSERDRFGTTDADEFIHYRYLLRKSGCKLYDAAGTDWTRKDISTVITAVVDGEKSEQEQHSISRRTLGGHVEGARDGQWQGGSVRFGFDVACYPKADKSDDPKELWRVVLDGPRKRLKAYPDCRTERYDGKNNFPRYQEETEVLRLAPSKDQGKIDALVSVFNRYATEAVSFGTLADYLNKLGWRNSQGGLFQGHHVERKLGDPTYLGYYAWNKQHMGKFHRYRNGENGKNGQTVLEPNPQEKVTRNDRADWVYSRRRLFDPLIDPRTWDAVQRKLDKEARDREAKPPRAPRSPAQYLARLVYCGNCGLPMVAASARKPTKKPRMDGHTGERYEYFCSSYHTACVYREREKCKCLRNGVWQDTLEKYIERYLEETGRRLELLTEGLDPDQLTKPMEDRLLWQYNGFLDKMTRLLDHIRDNDPEGWEEMWRDVPEGQEVWVDDAAPYYRRCFDPASIDERIAELEGQHDTLTQQCLKLSTERAIAKVNKQLADLETEIKGLEEQKQNLADIVEKEWREISDLSQAVAEAKRAMHSETGERALRQRAEAIRAVIQRIECTFTATGWHKRGGWGKKKAQLSRVTIHPLVGDPRTYPADPPSVLLGSSGVSRT